MPSLVATMSALACTTCVRTHYVRTNRVQVNKKLLSGTILVNKGLLSRTVLVNKKVWTGSLLSILLTASSTTCYKILGMVLVNKNLLTETVLLNKIFQEDN